jgi:glycerol-3-phosphate dehydrogenase
MVDSPASARHGTYHRHCEPKAKQSSAAVQFLDCFVACAPRNDEAGTLDKSRQGFGGKKCMADFDLAIIGGGINGVGIARDAAGRGLRVVLLEQSDLASGTSSASTKLIHGGLRYLEHGALRLVRESLVEREVLLRMAPHAIRPMRFVLPHHSALRPAWMLRLGLFLYDHLGGRKILPATRRIDLAASEIGAPLKPGYRVGFEYSDCWVDDARLVVLNAIDAAERSAMIRTHTRCVGASRQGGLWRVAVDAGGMPETIVTRALINAAGPWVAQLSETILQRPTPVPIRLVKGSHIVVPKMFDHDRAYIFQSADDRVVFAIPYEGAFTLIGTTDQDYEGDPGASAPTSAEIEYLCTVASGYFRRAVAPGDVVWCYSGVRPLYDDGASKAKDATRDYVLALDAADDGAPLLTVYGGKLTTYRRLAEEALDRLGRFLAIGAAWTRNEPLPGGGFAWDGVPAQVARARRQWPFLTDAQATRLVRAYGTRLSQVLGAARSPEALGPAFGHGLTSAEVRYLARHEWAEAVDDVLWRRSKLGLHLSADEQRALAQFMAIEEGRKAAV